MLKFASIHIFKDTLHASFITDNNSNISSFTIIGKSVNKKLLLFIIQTVTIVIKTIYIF